MRSLQVQELPDFVYHKLSEMAHKEHRTISQQATFLLEKALNINTSNQGKRKKIFDEIKREAEELKRYNLSAPATLIREDRER